MNFCRKCGELRGKLLSEMQSIAVKFIFFATITAFLEKFTAFAAFLTKIHLRTSRLGNLRLHKMFGAGSFTILT